MYKLSAFILLVLMASKAYAQDVDSVSKPVRDTVSKFHYGFCIGMASSSFEITETNVLHATGGNLDTLDHRQMVNGMPGSFFCFLFEYDFTNYFSIRLSPGFNFQQHAQNFYWNNGDVRLSRDSHILIHVPLYAGFGIPYKKNRLRLYAGASLSYKYDVRNDARLFTSYKTIDVRLQYARKIKKWIGGIELGYVKSLNTIELPSGLRGNDEIVIDRVRIGYYLAGLSLKF